jgi:mono/diheme cytochrome c family protein
MPLIERGADHVGGVIARAVGTDGVFIADEDHGVLRWIADTSPLLHPKAPPAPADAASSAAPSASAAPPPPATTSPSSPLPDRATEVAQEVLSMGGAPSNLVAIRDGALVTVRDPGKLVRVRRSDDGKLSVVHELPVAADAWGLALTEEGTRALVTSAWTSTVTLVEVSDAGLRKCAEARVGREPRGVLFASDGVAYVNHLVGNALTKLTLREPCNESSIGEVKTVVAPPSPVRSPAGKVLPASLGYLLALSPDRRRLFIPRHALGARSHSSWFGASTVDTLLLPDETPAAPMHAANLPGKSAPKLVEQNSGTEFENEPTESWSAFVQPRDIRYRRHSGTLLVVSEGADRLVELDAAAMDPSHAIAAIYELSDSFRRKLAEPLPDGFVPVDKRRAPYVNPSDANPSNNKSCAAPQGAVLDAREETAIVFCRASTTIARVRLHDRIDSSEDLDTVGLAWAPLGEDAGEKGINLGRRLFYSSAMAEGMGCAGCHPEGRDDGHVWREVVFTEGGRSYSRFRGGAEIHGGGPEAVGVPRRTPMLVGRVLPVGPYGWRGESEKLEKRIEAGTKLHAGDAPPDVPAYYVNALAVFLRKGLPKPPAPPSSLTPEQQKGKALFNDAKTACASCHEPTRYFSNFTPMKLPALPTLPGFEAEPDALYKTPSLLHVSRHGSLLHDGSARTLEELIEANGTRMGDTAHLTPEERKALVAYLETL